MIMISILIILNIEKIFLIQGNCRRKTGLWNMKIPRPTFLLKSEIDDVIWSGTTLSQQEEVKEFYSMIMVFGILICWFNLVCILRLLFIQKQEVDFLILFSTGFTNFSCVLLVVYWWYHYSSNGASTRFLMCRWGICRC